MFRMRSGYKENDKIIQNEIPIKTEEKKTTEINKSKLLDILKEMKALKESDTTALEDANEQELEKIILKLALMKVGYVLGNDNSIEAFYEAISCYESDAEVTAYWPL
jgi:hypothetical protein